MKKLCSKCCDGEALPNFAWCLACRKDYDMHRYISNKEFRDRQIRENTIRVKKVLLSYLNEIKAAGCKYCTESELCCMDFHHRGDDKEFNVSDAINAAYALSRVQKEVAKCDVICSNCHRKLHAGRKLSIRLLSVPD